MNKNSEFTRAELCMSYSNITQVDVAENGGRMPEGDSCLGCASCQQLLPPSGSLPQSLPCCMFKPFSVGSLLTCHHPSCQEAFRCWGFLIPVTCVPEMCPRSTARLSCCFITTSQGFLKEHNFFGSSTKHSLLGGELEDLFSILRGLFSIPH